MSVLDTDYDRLKQAQESSPIFVPTIDKSLYSNWDGDLVGYLTYMSDNGDKAASDKLYNYLLNEQSLEKARNWTASREDTQYQRLVQDLKGAGINPYILLQNGASPVSSSSSAGSYSGSQFSTKEKADKDRYVNIFKVLLSALPIIGAIAAAAI